MFRFKNRSLVGPQISQIGANIYFTIMQSLAPLFLML